MLSHLKSEWLLSLGQVIDFVSSVDLNFSIVLKKNCGACGAWAACDRTR